MSLTILHETPSLIVCLKPAGVSSERGGMPELLEAQCGGEIFCVHRLDLAVGGVMVYARDRETAARLSAAIAERRAEKEYLAVVEGRPAPERGDMRDLLYHDARRNKSFVVERQRRGVREAALSYRLLESIEADGQTLSLVRIRLHTGRSHQIRVQFASRRLPLLGDRRYGGSPAPGGIALWSASLSFPDPDGGEPLHFDALPPEIRPWSLFGLHNI